MRPKTLVEVAELAARGDSFDRCLANFLDEFYAAPAADALLSEPPLLAACFGDQGRVQDAYLAATAEELARRFDFPCPAWTSAEQRALHRPWFASPLTALRTVLLLESPPASARAIFSSAQMLCPAPEMNPGRKLDIDAAKKLPGEGFKRSWPPLIKMDAAVKAKVEKLFGGMN